MSSMQSIKDESVSSMLSHDPLSNEWSSNNKSGGGWGRGGRELARTTLQPGSINLTDVDLEYDSGFILKGANVRFERGRRYAVVGRNGVGKTSLLRVIDAGGLPGLISIGCLMVEQEVTGVGTVEEFMRDRDGRIADLETRIEEAETDEVESLCEELEAIEDERSKVKMISALEVFQAEHLISRDMSSLSGGERKRVALSSAALSNPDVLILDEPTNHLDVKAIRILRDFILGVESTVILVSHNRDLVDAVATDVCHMFDATLTYYPGNYNDFIGLKLQSDISKSRIQTNLNQARGRIEDSITKMQKQSKKDGNNKRLSQVKSRQKKLDRHGVEKTAEGHRWKIQESGFARPGSINASTTASDRKNLSRSSILSTISGRVAPRVERDVQFNFRPSPQHVFHEPLIRVEDAEFGYGDRADLYAEICVIQGGRIVVVGENGSGKTRLLKLLSREIEPKGGRVQWAGNLRVAVFSQMAADDMLEGVDGRITPLGFVSRLHPHLTEHEIRSELSAFGIGGDKGSCKVGLKLKGMSGGERIRVVLACLMLENPHVLILDEVSNHLDLDSVAALGHGLGKWDGSIVLCSHDSNLVRTVLTESDEKADISLYEMHKVDPKIGLPYTRMAKRLTPAEFESYWTM